MEDKDYKLIVVWDNENDAGLQDFYFGSKEEAEEAFNSLLVDLLPAFKVIRLYKP